ncbi:MAG: DUF1285 domain-containing protein [Pseudomonadota bacterium]
MKSSDNSIPGLEQVLAEIVPDPKDASKLPPVHLWNPDNCGDIGMEIRADGSWWHEGTRIGREKLVRLFSTILRKDEDGSTWLVTPYEKVIVQVEDAAFIAVRVDVVRGGKADQALVFTTNVNDGTVAGPDHLLRVETDPGTLEPSPYVHVRGRLEAKLTRAVFYELANIAVPNPDGSETLGVWSGGTFFVIGPSGG